MSYTKKTISGFSWQTILKLCSAAIVIGKTAVIARLLTPEDFGVFALVMIALGLVEASTQTGVNITLIQSKKNILYHLDTAWVIASIRGFIIAGIMVAVSFFLRSLYQQPLLVPYIALAALIPIIKGFINPALVTFRKDLQFFQEALFRFAILVIEVTSTIFLTYWYPVVSSLIIALIIAAIAEVVASFVCFKETPRYRYSKTKAKEIFAHTGDLSLASIMNYIHENGDDFIVGKLTSTHTLGLYHNAYALGHKVSYDFGRSLHHGLFPVLSKFADDTPRVRRALLRSLLVFSIIVWGASVPLFIFPHQVVTLVLGSQWTSISPSVPWLTIAGILQSYATVGYSVLMASKHFRPMNIHIFSSIVLMIVFLFLLVPESNMLGAAHAIVFSRLLTTPILIWAVYHSIKTTTRSQQ